MNGFVYLNDPSQVSNSMRENSNAKEKARKYLINRFGFDYDDFALEIEGFGMWRQFFGIHLENAVAEVICRIYGFERFDLTYLKDGFSTRNPFKMSLVRMRILRKGDGGTELLMYRLTDEFSENQVIGDISALNGFEKAYILHRRLMERLGYTSKSKDVSELLAEFTKHGLADMRKEEALKTFDRLFVVEKAGGVKIRIRYDYSDKTGAYVSKDGQNVVDFEEMVEFAERNAVLPSSETYYSQFFFFIPGMLEPNFIQIEAEFETADAEILRPALEGFWRVKKVTGDFPLLILMKDLNVWDEVKLTKNPRCVCICMDVDEMIGKVRRDGIGEEPFVLFSQRVALKLVELGVEMDQN